MNDEPQRHRIQVTCPECGHRQSEPALVITTQCRNCYQHYAVLDGQGVARKRSILRLARIQPEDANPMAESAPTTASKPPFRPQKPSPPQKPLLLRLLTRTRQPREVICFGCAHSFTAIPEARSSQCPKCGSYVSLLDYEIDQIWKRRIETRGNVVIRKAASISDTTLHCHHLTVYGSLHANADCSGDVVIRSHGRVTGTIRCRSLRVEKSSRVEFLQPIHAHSAYFDGEVRGQIFCTGPVTLEKRARFHGLIRTTELTMRPGAEQSGTVERIGTI
jgi:cytoskeletal protein CcmA (bactofilin family)/Zn finger protein HypA/HybF involved in hydrogenase expression